jgi:hypothetical protein
MMGVPEIVVSLAFCSPLQGAAYPALLTCSRSAVPTTLELDLTKRQLNSRLVKSGFVVKRYRLAYEHESH